MILFLKMADGGDEDVIFENSPLEKYLKEAGFTEIEPEKVDRTDKHAGDQLERGHEKDVADSNGFRFKDWMLSLYQRYLSSDEDKLLSARKTYASIVINSGTLSEDDNNFLFQFDPELFHIPGEEENIMKERAQYFSLPYWVIESTLSISVLLVAVFLASNYWQCIFDHKVSSIGASLVMCLLGYYVWRLLCLRVLHNRNVQILKNYTSEVKSFVTIFRKSVMLIQELELISKGYTLVGIGMQIGYQQDDNEGESTRNIYPRLRQNLCDNGMEVLLRSCLSVEKIFDAIPFAPEVTGVFTCISSNPLSQFGLGDYSQSEKLSVCYLKHLLSAVASQQSEFLGRFLLSLSHKARLSEMTLQQKSFATLVSGFYDQLAVLSIALKSLKLSYHLHKSALTFAGDNELHHGSPNNHPQSKWTEYYMSVHSLELHLKACLTRMQFMNTLITNEIEPKEPSCTSSDDPGIEYIGTHNAMCMKDLESNYNLLKNELDSAICCWKEGLYKLKMISGVKKSETLTPTEETDDKEDINEHTNSVYISSMVEPEEIMGDYVFEGYTDFDDDSDFQQTRLTREELEKESRSQEESQHLLQELKNVLLTKAKDPLITDAGFVKPYKRQNNQNEYGKEPSIENTLDNLTEILVNDSKVNDIFKKENNLTKEEASGVKSDNQSNTKEISGEDTRDTREPLIKIRETLSNRQWSSNAFTKAIQEAARSRGNALMEESYGSSDSD